MPSPTVKLEGAVDRPTSYTAADLAARTPVTQTVTYASGSASQTRTYTGADLWALLSDAGVQTDGARKNDLLNRYVIATGADGYRAVFSLGELSPDFGNRANILAYAEVKDGASAALSSADGPFRVTAPTDIKGGRYVSNLVQLKVLPSAAATASAGGGTAASFMVTGQVSTVGAFDINALKGLPAVTQTVGSNVYTGVSLWTLLNSIGLKLPSGKTTLSMVAVATGSDGYRALVSLGEIEPGFGNNGTIVAYEVNGAALGSNGMARLVVPGEVKQGRSVSNLIAIEVFAVDGS
ncbi:MAG: molybdopterin-dependent oxidoreductase [Pseudomonadota bacterium]|nr:molybdopterin-dependent oxidoreductase [Pseudomonadota bacterium]